MCGKNVFEAILNLILLLTVSPAAAQIVVYNVPVNNESDADTVKTKENVLYIGAEVKDHIDHEPLKGVRAELLHADSTFADTVHVEYLNDTTWNYKSITCNRLILICSIIPRNNKSFNRSCY